MKKYLYFIATAILGIFAASCAKESREAALDTKATVFSVKAPFAVTKAMNDGLSATDLTFAVYDDGGNYLQSLSEGAQVAATADGWTVTVSLVKQMTYNFFFFAQSQKAVADSYYNIDLAAKTLTVDYAKAGSNNEFADAFYKAFEMTIDDSFNGDVTLVRPFAQINAAVSDLAVAEASNISLADMTTGFKVKNAFTTLNILDGSVDGEQEIELPLNAKLSGTISADGSDYDWIAAAYLLVDQKQTADITLSLKSVNSVYGADVNIVREVTNVPLQRNYRTNLLGPLFSSSYTFNVNIDEGFITPEQNVDLEMTFARANTTMAAGNPGYIAIAAQGGENTLVLPDDAGEITIDVLCATTGTITVKYPDGASAYPAKVNLLLRASELVANLEHSTVTITKGSNIATGTFATASSTLIIEEGATVTNLIVNAGSTKIYGTVETISGTAKDDAAFYINSLESFKAFRDAVNGGRTYTDFNVKLECDLDLANEPWTPIGLASYVENFKGNFDGMNHVISNLKVNHVKTAGLFGCMNRGFVKNLVIDGVDIHSNHFAGGIVAWIEKGAYAVGIEGCTVKNGSIISVPELVSGSYDNGDKIGGIIGYAHAPTITNNTVENVSLTAYRDLAAIAGYACKATVTGNSAKNCIVRQNNENAYKDAPQTTYAEIIGRDGGSNTVSDNSFENVELTSIFTRSIAKNSTETSTEYVVAEGEEVNLESIANDINSDQKESVSIDVTGSEITWTTGGAHGSTAILPEANTTTKEVVIDGGGTGVFVAEGAGVGDIRAVNEDATIVFRNITIIDHSKSYAETAWEFGYLEYAGKVTFENCKIKSSITLDSNESGGESVFTFINCTFESDTEVADWNPKPENMYLVWISAGKTTFTNCDFTGFRGVKIHEAYGSDVESVTFEGCTFHDISKKPGIAIGTVNAATAISIKNCSFTNCAAGDQNNYATEIDTDTSTFDYTFDDNTIVH